MKRAPYFLAFFFVAITISRVAMFVQTGLRQDWQGWPFAIGLAIGVYVSAYFVRYKETKWVALICLVLFGSGDLLFNEIELVRVLSSSAMVSDKSNFVGLDASVLQVIMQFSALFFGGFPTVAAAGLGWLQSGAERIAFLNKGGKIGNFQVGIRGMFGNWFSGQEGMRVVQEHSDLLTDGQESSRNLPVKKRWPQLSQDDRNFLISATMTEALLRFGGSSRRINGWKQDIRDGK